MKVIEGGIGSISDVNVYGLRNEIKKESIGIIVCKGSTVGIFSQNKLKSASSILNKSCLPGEIELILINNGCANIFDSENEFKNQKELINTVAEEYNVDDKSICSISTGSIGNNIDMDWLKLGIKEINSNLKEEYCGDKALLTSLMCDNSTCKQFAIEIDGIRIGGIAKYVNIDGPRMAMSTIILYTDAKLPSELVYYTESNSLYEVFQNCFNKAFDLSFNMIATNEFINIDDIALLTTTNKNKIDLDRFQIGLNYICFELAKMIAKDLAKNSKYIEVFVIGAKTKKDASSIAKIIAKSCKYELNFFNNIENFGTIISRIGNSDASIFIKRITIVISNGVQHLILCDEGTLIKKSFNKVDDILNSKNIIIKIDIGIGNKDALSWGYSI